MKVDIEFTEEFQAKLKQQTEELKKILIQPAQKPVYNDLELRELLGVSAKTTQNWRFSGKIGYSQVGRTIIYSW